jgi:hypothetical protein
MIHSRHTLSSTAPYKLINYKIQYHQTHLSDPVRPAYVHTESILSTAKTMLEMMQVMPQNRIYMHKEEPKTRKPVPILQYL